MPGREEAFKALALEVMGEPPAEAVAAADAAGDGKQIDLSKTDLEQAAPAPTQGAEPTWTPEQEAWFAKMDTAKTPEEIAAAQKAAPQFSAEQLAWLKEQPEPGAEPVKVEDHLADDAELKGKLDAKTQERINGRIGKEVAKTKAEREAREAAETRVRELETQLSQRPTSPNAKTAVDEVYSPQQLQEYANRATDAKTQAEDLLLTLEDDPAAVEAALREQGFKLTNAAGEEEYTPARMRKLLSQVKTNAARTLERDVPKRAEYLKNVDASAADAMTIYPELKDKNSDRRKQFDAIVNQHPFIKSSPWWPRATALLILGMETEAKMKGGAGTQPAKRSKRPMPVVIPQPRGTPPAPAPTQVKSNANDVVAAALNGDRKARLKHLQSLVS